MRAFTIFLFISLAVLTGCELFETREPELPSGGTSGGWQFPRNPRTVLDNMTNAVGRWSSVDYLRTFTYDDIEITEYEFIPDPVTVINYPRHFDGWNLERERKHIVLLFNPMLRTDSIAVVNFDIDRETVIGDSAGITARYNLHIGHKNNEAPRQMEGRVEFAMLRGTDGGWIVHRWIDSRIANEPCWSDLKAEF